MKLRKLTKIIMAITAFVMVLSLASCVIGGLKLESFTVDRTSIKTNYLIGEEIDFSGIKAVAKYSDESLNKIYTFEELTITYADDITATEGEKFVTVSFDDPHLNVKQEAKVAIRVTKEPVVGGDEQLIAVQFEKPASLIQFNSANTTAGQIKYGEAGFWGQFAEGGKIYSIGNENEFRLNPQFAVLSADGESVLELKQFYATVEIAVEKDGAYVALTKTEGENNVVTYKDGETVIATVDTYKGLYHFDAAAAGMKVKISVLPNAEFYIGEFNPVVLEAKVIKAYNVYEAWQLAVIDNYKSEWAEIKAANGLLDVTVSGVVFHNDIKLTADDIPAEYILTTDKDVVYTNTIDNSTITIPAGTKFIKEWTEVYDRRGASNFVMEGNFFLLDTSAFPRVPSPAVFGADAEKDYGDDFSNVTLFAFSSEETGDLKFDYPYPEGSAVITISNLSLIGNAKRDYLVDADGNLASAGGVIFCKSRYCATTIMDNIIGNSYFITYFPESTMELTSVKCFDTYQNAAFVWGAARLEVKGSYIEGCGGPVIIAQSVLNDNAHPTVNVKDSVVKTSVEGTEIWFTSVGANTIVGQIKALGNGLGQAGLGNFVDASGKMNIMAGLMAEGSDASQIVMGITAQGSIDIDGGGMDRYLTQENVHWATIKGISEYAAAMSGQMPPFFTVYAADGTPCTIYYNGTTFVDLAGNALGTAPEHAALFAAFQAAETITLTQGGLSVVFEFYH